MEVLTNTHIQWLFRLVGLKDRGCVVGKYKETSKNRVCISPDFSEISVYKKVPVFMNTKMSQIFELVL